MAGRSMASALVFGLHPVNTESVSFISSRNNILVCLFSLMSFLVLYEPGSNAAYP